MVKWAIVLESFVGPTLYLKPINPNKNSKDHSNWHTQLEGGMGHYNSIVFGPTKFHIEKTNVC